MNETIEQMEVRKASKPECYHCGEPCPDQSIAIEDKFFCCEGCKIVFSILDENGLCQYYDLNEFAGISQKRKSLPEYAFLEDPETIDRLLDYADETQHKATFYLPQIHCSSCLWLLEKLHLLNPGINHSRVNFLKKEAQVDYDPKESSLRQVVETLASIGYAPHIQLDALEEDKKPVVEKSLYYKLGLAGFAFGNIMLLSFPEYLGLSNEPDRAFHAVFGYINLLLSLPVILYSGRDYLRSAWQGIRQKHLNIDVPVSLGILALFSRSAYEILTQTGAGYLDSLAGLVFFLLIGKWFQQKTYARISFDRDFRSYFPIACTVRKDGAEKQVTLDKLAEGDIVLLRHGELIPADALLLKGEARIDYSFVTGESAPVDKSPGDRLYAGGKQEGGLVEIQVVKKVSNSYLTQLWNDHTFTKLHEKGKTSAIADRVASFFTWAILVIAGATLAFWLPRDAGIAINAFTAVLIVACPCAVALSIPFTFGNVLRIFSKEKIYLKNVRVIEALAGIKKIVFDKTGTITQVGASELSYQGAPLTAEDRAAIHGLARQSNHPLSRQVAALFNTAEILPVDAFNEEKGKGIAGHAGGRSVKIGSASFVGLGAGAGDAFRQSVYVQFDEEIMGHFSQRSAYRNRLAEVLGLLGSWAELSLLSGDHDGEQENLAGVFGDANQLHFNQRPAQKLEYIRSLQSGSHDVAMVGDGLNDAGALSQSDVGIVITEDTSNFTPACDIIMDASGFHKLPLVFSFARLSIRLVYAAYLIALVYNVVGLSFAVRGALSPVIAAILMPLSSISIVLFGVGASTLMAYAKKLTGK